MALVTIYLKCVCGCGEDITPGRKFRPGHDQILRAKLEAKVGGLIALKKLVEKYG